MTLMKGEKYNETKWKNGYENGAYLDKPTPNLTIRISSALLVMTVIWIVLLKLLVVLSGKSITYMLENTVMEIFAIVQLTANWILNDGNNLIWSSLKGLSWIIASWSLLYFDSERPGLNPPMLHRKMKYGNENCSSGHHIGYVTTLLTGCVIFCLSLMNAS